MKKSIAVLGQGYIGLPFACLLANAGYQVVGIDIDSRKIDMLKSGKSPFLESGLDVCFQNALDSGNFSFNTELKDSYDVYIIAVPTPEMDHKADLTYVFEATEMISRVIRKNDLVILESTVSPGTSQKIYNNLSVSKSNLQFSHVPEKAIPGNTLYEILNNDRIIGSINDISWENTCEIYKSFVRGDIIRTDLLTAEVSKLLENSFRDINIAFANTILQISHELGFDALEAIKLANKHPRVNILNPGTGVGGHCIPVDPWFLVGDTKVNQLIQTSRAVNDSMPKFWVDRIVDKINYQNLKSSKIGILGIAYKPNIDDLRESPSIEIIKLLRYKGFEVKISDPYVLNFNEMLYDPEVLVKWADIIVITTNHDIFQKYLSLNKTISCFQSLRKI